MKGAGPASGCRNDRWKPDDEKIFAAVGTNGAVVAGTYQPANHGRSFKCQITVQTTKPEGLTAPVNVMYVDRRGEAALVVLRP